MGRLRHLHDDRLFECFLASHDGEAPDPRVAEHLADCDACSTRFGEIVSFMSGIREEAERESDEVFTPERLRQQREQVMRRLEHVSRSARVITFPGHPATGVGPASTRIGPRWLAAAAAAGVIVGVAVGGRFSSAPSAPPMQVAAAPTRVTTQPAVRVSTPEPADDPLDDDTFLSELEIALERPHTRALQPFDALTPFVVEIDSRSR